MIQITVDDHMTSFDKILAKESNSITFKDIISLIFHAINQLLDISDMNHWQQIYSKFEKELSIQNKYGWPQITIIRNDYSKRMDISSGGSYLVSSNILTLLLRLLYVENYKRRYVHKSYNYRKILSHKIKGLIEKPINEMSMEELIGILKTHLNHYLKIYCDESHFEYQLGNAILKQI